MNKKILPILLLSLLPLCLSLRLHLAPSYKDNLQPSNWYYGSTSQKQYRIRIFKAATSNNLTTCPLDRPYSSSDLSRCQNCGTEAPLRNLGTSLCERCPDGQVYDGQVGNCTGNATTNNNSNGDNNNNTTNVQSDEDDDYVPIYHPPVKNSTKNTTNSTNVTTVTNTTASTNTTTVSPSPNNNNDKNVTSRCPASTPLFNKSSNSCTPCPPATEYLNTTETCLPILYISNLQKSTNLIQPYINFTQDQSNKIIQEHPTRKVQTCPPDKPYLSVLNNSNGVCLGCNATQYYAAVTQKCIGGCPAGTIYNTTEKICKLGSLFTNPQANNLLAPSQQQFQIWNQTTLNSYKNAKNGQFCPSATPYQIDNQCSKCGQYFNVVSKKCEECEQGRKYDDKERVCKGQYSDTVSISRMVADIF